MGDVGVDEVEFSCEVTSFSVTHEIEEIGEERTMMCGTVRPAETRRRDGVKFGVENDLSTEGIYAYTIAFGSAIPDKALTFTPNTAVGATWEGIVRPYPPASLDGEEYGSPITSEVEWPAVGLLDFTPAAAVP